MKVKYQFLFILLMCAINQLFAQRDSITTRVIIIDGDATESNSKSGSGTKYLRNVIKINPFLFLNGDIPIYYERVFNSKFSGEVGLGVTHVEYLNDVINELEDPAFGLSVESKSKVGGSFKLGLRYYPDGYAPEDFYMALEYGYRSYIQEHQEYVNSSRIHKTTQVYNELKFIIGWHQESYWWDGWFWDYYIGTGAKFVNQDILKEFTYNQPGTFSTGYYYKVEPESKMVVGFYLGLKMGVAF